MKFSPKNRYLLVQTQKQEDADTGVLLPEGFQPKAEFEVAKVVAVASDCNSTWKQGSFIVFPSNMLQQVDINGSKVNLVSENYVLGYVED